MLDRIDERDKQERMHRSIVKYWNVNYIPTPYAEPKEEQTGEKEDAVTGQQLPVEPELTVSSANYGNEEVTDDTKSVANDEHHFGGSCHCLRRLLL